MTRNNTAGQTALLFMESKIFQNGGEYLDNKNFICLELNKKLTLNPLILASHLDIAHPLPSRKGDAMIVKFL